MAGDRNHVVSGTYLVDMSISLHSYHEHKHISALYNITLAGLRPMDLHQLNINLSAQLVTHLVTKRAPHRALPNN